MTPLLGGCVATGSSYTDNAQGAQGATSDRRAATAAAAAGTTAAATAGTTAGTAGAGTGAGTGTSGGASSVGAGSVSGNGGSGGSTGSGACGVPQDCPASGTALPFTGCNAGQVEVITNLVDFKSQEDLTCPVSVSDVGMAQFQAVSNDCGYLFVCAEPGTEFSMSLTVPNYVPLIFATINAQASTQIPNSPGLAMLTTQFLGIISGAINGFNASDPIVLTSIYPHNFDAGTEPPVGPCANRGGYTMKLVDSSGNTVDAGVCYASYTYTCEPTTPAQGGFALFYNIDPSIKSVSVQADNAANDDAGIVCQNLESALPWELTGQVFLQESTLSYVPYIVAAPPPN